MKINELKIDGFGVWSGLEVDDLADEATLFFGPNEAGKTTLMQFVRAVLYGFSPERRERYFPPVNGGRAGGTLQVEGPQGHCEIHRLPPSEKYLAGRVRLTAEDGSRHGSETLGELLAGIDEAIFNNVFAVGLREIQELGVLDDTEAAQQLYMLSSGLDRVSLVEVMRRLESQRVALLAAGDRPSQVGELLDRRQQLELQVEQLLGRSQGWCSLHQELAALDDETNELEQTTEALQRQARIIEVAVDVRWRWQQRAALDAELAALPPIPPLPDRAIERLESLNEKIVERREKLSDIKRQRTTLREQAAIEQANRAIWAQRARIEAVSEHGPWIASLQGQVNRLSGEIASLQAEHHTHWGDLGDTNGATPATDPPSISRRTIASLRDPARALREQAQRLDQARSEQQTSGAEAERLTLDLEAELIERGETDLLAALQQKGEHVAQLRQRLKLEERIDQLHRTRDELEDRTHDQLDAQVLSMPMLAVLGVLVVCGVMLILIGLLGSFFLSLAGIAGLGLAVLGIGGVGAAVGLKIVAERTAARRLEDGNRQLAELGEELQQAKEQRDNLDAELPAGGGALDSRLKASQEELAKLEELLPLDAQRQAADQRHEAAGLRIAQSEASIEEARSLWQEALRKAGLPVSLAPKQIRQLAQQSASLSHVHNRLTALRSELDQREHELLSVTQRIEQLASDVGVPGQWPRRAVVAAGPGRRIGGAAADHAASQDAGCPRPRTQAATRQSAARIEQAHRPTGRTARASRRRRSTGFAPIGGRSASGQPVARRAVAH